MEIRHAFYQAFRELRANGRIGYLALSNPRARMAAAEAFRLRAQEDALQPVMRRIFKLQAERLLRSYPIQL